MELAGLSCQVFKKESCQRLCIKRWKHFLCEIFHAHVVRWTAPQKPLLLAMLAACPCETFPPTLSASATAISKYSVP